MTVFGVKKHAANIGKVIDSSEDQERIVTKTAMAQPSKKVYNSKTKNL